MPNYINLQNLQYTYLGKGSDIKGDLTLYGTTHLGSHILGNIVMKDLADIIIEISGSLEGQIRCHNLEIFGKLKGSIISSGKITIHPSAEVSGEIKAKNLVIHPGSTVNCEGHTLENI